LFTLRKTKAWPATVVPWDERNRCLANHDHPLLLLAREDELPLLRSLAAEHEVTVRELPNGFWAALIPKAAGPST